MRLFLLGATGGTGAQLLDQALRQGDEVTAFVRSPQKIAHASPKLHVIKGDPRDTAHLAEALVGHDAVISALSASTLGPTTFQQDAVCSLVNAMAQAGVQRLVQFSVALLFPDMGLFPMILGRVVFPNVIRDSAEMERIVRASDRDWTLVRPPQLTDNPRTDRYRAQADHMPRGGRKISRADAAAFALAEVVKHEYPHRIVGICD